MLEIVVPKEAMSVDCRGDEGRFSLKGCSLKSEDLVSSLIMVKPRENWGLVMALSPHLPTGIILDS